jgi:nucleotide-binding universal stress UspA family protein
MFEHLLVPVDGNALSDRAMDQSIVLALKLGAALTGFVAEPHAGIPAMGHNPSMMVREIAQSDQRAAAHANQVLSHFAAKAKAAGVSFKSHFVSTLNVDDAIVQAAQDCHCDLIVMVTHGRGAFGELLFGSHTKNVLSRSKTALLVLH